MNIDNENCALHNITVLANCSNENYMQKTQHTFWLLTKLQTKTRRVMMGA